ncbi:hypothetical protein COJ03_27165 [Bacillus cereus]|uniref:hypothetical protein n=1 Tax=Bacillus cereus TaxID=1396 RepID=UPI000BF3B1D5|nr:hypothetical protein [Bacillus cereus]PFK17891.1 hypothetical protein COJ03_27165 [Bacillus cereus]
MANQWVRRSVVLYKKTDNREEQIALFRSMNEAIKWANANNIMSVGWAIKSLKLNVYPTPILSSKRFPHASRYRFEHAPNQKYPEELYTIPLRDINYGHSESYDSSNHAGIPCEVYKNNQKLGTFSSVGEAKVFLEDRIGGALGSGLYALLKGWVPSESSQLYGYSMKRLDRQLEV